jgi:hypothetical protein
MPCYKYELSLVSKDTSNKTFAAIINSSKPLENWNPTLFDISDWG